MTLVLVRSKNLEGLVTFINDLAKMYSTMR